MILTNQHCDFPWEHPDMHSNNPIVFFGYHKLFKTYKNFNVSNSPTNSWSRPLNARVKSRARTNMNISPISGYNQNITTNATIDICNQKRNSNLEPTNIDSQFGESFSLNKSIENTSIENKTLSKKFIDFAKTGNKISVSF